jgi:post-segregation antitoxin (ccd killing protein)
MPLDANAMTTKGNVELYLDKELVEKSKDLGFNLLNTFENHLKTLNESILSRQFNKQLRII